MPRAALHQGKKLKEGVERRIIPPLHLSTTRQRQPFPGAYGTKRQAAKKGLITYTNPNREISRAALGQQPAAAAQDPGTTSSPAQCRPHAIRHTI